jgi:hypothetical protein
LFYVSLCFSIVLSFSPGTWWCIASLILLFFCFMFLYLFLGTWLDTCIFWPAFGSNYLNALVLQEHCIQCHHGLAPENSTGSLCFSLACIWSFLVLKTVHFFLGFSLFFSILLYSSLLVSKRLFEAFWVANNLYIIHYNSITKKIFKHVNLS